MIVILAFAIAGVLAGLGVVFLLFGGVRWRLISLWPALVVAVALALVLASTRLGGLSVPYAIVTGAILYGVFLLCWPLISEGLRRHFDIRF